MSETQKDERLEHLKAAASRRVAQEASNHRVRLKVDESFNDRADFDKLSWIKPRMAVDYCEKFSREWKGGIKPPLLFGPSGCGKTHLLWATAKGIASAHNAEVNNGATFQEGVELSKLEGNQDIRNVIWPSLDLLVTDGSEIAHEIRSSVSKGNLDEVIWKFRQEKAVNSGGSAILFIDDVEVAKMSDWLHEELYRIFNRRYARRIQTFITTNLNPGEMRAHLGDRITRRIMDMTEPFVLG